ncbi:MAG: hypothetical protein M3Q23_15640 [Actinomycetota bacterium]|nr:hypothetical protein [Actinomycetota bacterium]
MNPRLRSPGPVVEIHIEELVLDGVGPEQVSAIEEHLRVELARRMAGGRFPAWTGSDTREVDSGGHVSQVVAARVAEAIHERMAR